MRSGEKLPLFKKPSLVVIDNELMGDVLRPKLLRLRCRWDGGHVFDFPHDPELSGEYELGIDEGHIYFRDAVEGGQTADRAWKLAAGKARCFSCKFEGGRELVYDLDRGGEEVDS